MTAQTPVYGIKYPVIGEPIRTTRQILEDNAKAVEAALIAGPASPPAAQDLATLSGRVTTLEAGTWTSYTPAWAAVGGAPSVGNGTLVGRHRKVGRWVELDIFLLFGSTTSGGSDAWTFTLPFASSADREHQFSVKGFAAAGNFVGVAYAAGGASIVNPMGPMTATSSMLDRVRNAAASNAAGTGIPQASGAYSFGTNHNLAIFGRYESAS